ncbi:MAG: formylglycine-generating enzyme family protein [Elainella sp. C42_A2020_010]|nr:formylglycine-generating enzyme family protein [Elainella sp. C42_A2020_010]
MTSLPQLSVVQFNILTVDPRGQPQSQQSQSAQVYCELVNGVGLELVAIPGGSFRMGAPKTEPGWHPSQGPQHTVNLNPIWIGKYPVTQAQWRAVAALPLVNQPLASHPACFAEENRPVEQVSWYEAVEFCLRLSHHTGRSYRLPSEAEWEYACRAGTTTPFHFGETLTTDLANYSGVNWDYQGKICSKGAYGQGPEGVDRRETTKVGELGSANAFGLYDMHGQVREWCQDCWHRSYEGAPSDGSAWAEADCQQRILRGGSWNSSPNACRSAFRNKLDADAQLYDVGFRVVSDSLPM